MEIGAVQMLRPLELNNLPYKQKVDMILPKDRFLSYYSFRCEQFRTVDALVINIFVNILLDIIFV
jgi:hypothetical protein